MKPMPEIETIAQTQLDTQMAKTKPVKLGWTSEEIENITNSLNELMANYSVHYQKVRNYHWNVKGHDFFDLHEKFELLYKEAQQHIDDIAERICVFGKTPLSTLKEYLDLSQIKETGSDLSSDIMVREILSDFRILLQYMVSVIDVTSSQNDSGTEEMVKVFIHHVEKHHWMFTAFMAK